MNAIPFIYKMLQEDALKTFLQKHNGSEYLDYRDLVMKAVIKVEMFMKTAKFRDQDEGKKQALVESVLLTVRKVADFRSKIIPQSSQSDSSNTLDNDLINEWKETLDFILGVVDFCNTLRQANPNEEFEDTDVDVVIKFRVDMEGIENMILDGMERRALLLKKAFPALCDLKDRPEVQTYLLDLSKQLDNLPKLICDTCDGQPALALVLVGSLLSLKEKTYDRWYKVNEDLDRIRSNPPGPTSEINNNEDGLFNIIQYCYDDLPYFLKPCFLYLACYQKEYEIPARSLTEIWIAEDFIAKEHGKTAEEIANNYLELLVQRSLVQVSRSFLGTIKHCRVHKHIHSFANKQSEKESFLFSNPKKEMIESLFRLAIHQDEHNQYTELKNSHMHSFLAFNFNRNIITSAVFLEVLELRNSAIPETALPNMTYIRYLGLRGCSIAALPEGIGHMENLQTLDVRDTHLTTLPGSLWDILTLRHVYVSPWAKIEGPPPTTAKSEDLQVLKTVVVPESWLKNCPQFLDNLTKLALTKPDNLGWKSVSGLIEKLVHLLSLTIIGDSLPSEYVDTRAYPNLESVKSIKLEGIWRSRNLFIDDVKFPPNLAKLTLTNSQLKDDPMPRLARLPALKFLHLGKKSYEGEQMICSTDGFPLLQRLELSELASLKEVLLHPTAMMQKPIVQVIRCNNLDRSRLENHPNIQIEWDI